MAVGVARRRDMQHFFYQTHKKREPQVTPLLFSAPHSHEKPLEDALRLLGLARGAFPTDQILNTRWPAALENTSDLGTPWHHSDYLRLEARRSALTRASVLYSPGEACQAGFRRRYEALAYGRFARMSEDPREEPPAGKEPPLRRQPSNWFV